MVAILIGALCGVLPAALGQSGVQVPPELTGEDVGWVDGWRVSATEQADMLNSAYALDDDTYQAVLRELETRMVLQQDYERRMMAELEPLVEQAKAAGDDENAPAVIALTQRVRTLASKMPLDEEGVSQWVENRLPPETVQEGRRRLEELRYRRNQYQCVGEDDLRRQAGGKKEAIGVRRARTAPLSEQDRPMPLGPRGTDLQAEAAQAQNAAETRRVVRPNAEVRGEPQAPAAPPKIDPAAGKEPQDKGGRGKDRREAGKRESLAPAPPLDEWDRYVASVAEKYDFTDAQLTKAQAILRDLRSRAYQYRLSRSHDYARAEILADPKARSDTLKQLNEAIDAMFDELKARLEALPTLAQKQRAEGGGKK